jgi:hypothetical protein
MTRFAFILGCPRSGTTFLVRALQPLDGAEVVSGLIFPPHVAHLPELVDQPVRDAVDRSLSWSLEYFADYAARSRGWAAGEWFKRNLSTRELVATVRGRRSIDLLVFKEPFLAFSPALALRAVPDARLVYIHRDGRDCADSLERKYGVLRDETLRGEPTVESPVGRRHGGFVVPWWVAEGEEDDFLDCSPYLRSVWMWREMVARCRTAFEQPEVVASDRVAVVSYEELMADPIGVGGRVVGHLGRTTNRGVTRRLREAHTASIGVHRRRDASEIERATALAHDELARLGYV